MNEIIDAIALLEAEIRAHPQAQNSSSALSALNAIATHMARIYPALTGLSAGADVENPYNAEVDGETVVVDPRAERLARNESLRTS